MKKFIVGFALLFVAITAYGQKSLSTSEDVFIPKTLSAGTSMSARSVGATYDDTTQTFKVRGLAAVWIGLEIATNDSIDALVYYRTSKDGVNFNGSGFTAIDSLTTTGTTSAMKYIALPAAALGAHSVQIEVAQSTTVARYSVNPSTTLTTKIIRVPYNKQ